MQAQRLDKPQPIAEKPLSLVETAVPQPGPGQIRLKVAVCGVCHTDLHSVTFAPAGWIIPLALRHLRPGGTLAINAIHMSTIPELAYDLIYGERVLRSVANFTRQDAFEFLQLAGEIPIATTVETAPLAEANEMLGRLKASEIRGRWLWWCDGR